ncbi:class I SAM-dependent methyltransferase [Thermoactinospora rubra]|uniref:class I SAM-dependent methyltransferase n=1 Tax=Thermoactinospora rubra TaxID=1088767 RepID=UPI001F0A2D34|nr:class I SAM-dependent methyltransferase [Thermoactinospora rubra]
MNADELDARWRAYLESWAIPPEILAKAPADPWGHSPARFGARTDRAMVEADSGPTTARLAEVLPGSVLDVGAGTGAASLPLRDRVTSLTAVDSSPAMLAELLVRADKLGIPTTVVEGRWPDVAGSVGRADAAVAAHVVYNVPDLAAFLRALNGHARRRVVIELTHRHPMSWLNPLWEQVHGVRRPVRPIAEDAVSLADALGFDVRVEEREAPLERFGTIEELAASACHRLCLDPSRAAEIAETAQQLGMWPVPRDRWVTIWWDVE